MIRRLLVLLALLCAPAIAAAQDFDCDERALDLSACTDPTDLSTCPSVCTDPANPATCGMLPLPELPDPTRQAPDQPILRQVAVREGPFTGVALSMIALNAAADAAIAEARDQFCTAPPPLEPPAPPPPPLAGGSPGLAGGSPGIVGGNPGIVGGNPRLSGGDPGINIRR